MRVQLLLACQWWGICICVPANTSADYESFLKALPEQCDGCVSNLWMMKCGKADLPALVC